MSIHLRPTAPLAERALLPADPGLALSLAQALLDRPVMFNHSRGLWGYTGVAADGLELTIQSTGIGGPSAVIVLEELAGLGLRRAIRVGTGDGLGSTSATQTGPALGLGDLVIADAAVAGDGASRALGADGRSPADVDLSGAMSAASPGTRRGVVFSTDVFYRRTDVLHDRPDDLHDRPEVLHDRPDDLRDRPDDLRGRSDDPVAVDLETAALFTAGRLLGVAVGCVIVVSDIVGDGRRAGLDDHRLELACEQAGRLAAAGLGVRPGGGP